MPTARQVKTGLVRQRKWTTAIEGSRDVVEWAAYSTSFLLTGGRRVGARPQLAQGGCRSPWQPAWPCAAAMRAPGLCCPTAVPHCAACGQDGALLPGLQAASRSLCQRCRSPSEPAAPPPRLPAGNLLAPYVTACSADLLFSGYQRLKQRQVDAAQRQSMETIRALVSSAGGWAGRSACWGAGRVPGARRESVTWRVQQGQAGLPGGEQRVRAGTAGWLWCMCPTPSPVRTAPPPPCSKRRPCRSAAPARSRWRRPRQTAGPTGRTATVTETAAAMAAAAAAPAANMQRKRGQQQTRATSLPWAPTVAAARAAAAKSAGKRSERVVRTLFPCRSAAPRIMWLPPHGQQM